MIARNKVLSVDCGGIPASLNAARLRVKHDWPCRKAESRGGLETTQGLGVNALASSTAPRPLLESPWQRWYAHRSLPTWRRLRASVLHLPLKQQQPPRQVFPRAGITVTWMLDGSSIAVPSTPMTKVLIPRFFARLSASVLQRRHEHGISVLHQCCVVK